MLQTVGEFLAEKENREPCLIEPGLLPHGGKLILYGAPGVGKSLLVSQMGLEVASGIPWVGTMPTEQGRIIYIQCEIGRGQFRDRLRRQMRKYSIQQEMVYVASSLTIRLARGDREFEEVYHKLEELHPSLLILDPQYKLYGGDENSNTDIKAFYNMIDWVASNIGCSVVLVSHNRKARYDAEGGVSDRGFEELKGASRQQDWADTIVRLMATSSGHVLKFEKTRNGEPIGALPLIFDKETLTFVSRPGARTNVEADILGEVGGGPKPRTALMQFLVGLGHSESTVKRGLMRLEETGSIVMKPMPGNATAKIVEKK